MNKETNKQTRRKILLVEDNIHLSELYKRILEKAQFAVVTALTGQQALEKANEGTYDLILLDIMLPQIPGTQLIKLFRQSDSPVKNTPVILITNLGQEDIILQAFRDGADGYILKSEISVFQLVEEIKKFLDRSKPAK
jgi:DNA-binding response OmpR family regulator